MTRREFIRGTTGALGAMGGAPDAPEPGAEIAAAELRAVRETARRFMRRYEVPGMSIAYAKDDRLVYIDTFGLADPESGAKVTPASRFRIASISKPLTSAALYTLIEMGRLKLTDTVFGDRGLLGTTYGKQPYGRFVEQITVENLLTHTAGGWVNDGRDPMFKHPRYGHGALISWTLDSTPLEHAPGTSYGYSNFGYCVLGRIIEKVTGQSYAEFVLQSIAKPCRISSMAIAGNSLDSRQPDEVRYVAKGDGDPYGLPVSRMDSHGGWISTAADLLRFAVRVNGLGTVPEILKPQSIRSMTTASIANPKYAKGWAVNELGNWWHSGSLPGTATILVRTSGGFCWTALTNTRRPDTEMSRDLDRLMWDMMRKVSEWPNHDLF